jgi:glycosyltransferase involved in cell wall biosynthesis
VGNTKPALAQQSFQLVKILMSAYDFDPSIGGIETASRLLATEFVRLGHVVKLVTKTGTQSRQDFIFEVIRKPSAYRMLKLLRWADVYFQNHVSLLLGWPLLLVRKPWVVTQQVWLPGAGMRGAWKGSLKRLLLHFATTVSISRDIATDIPSGTHVIGNPYDAETFREMSGVKRETELIFVGRLGIDKGAHLLLDALALLNLRGRRYRLTVVGGGGEEEALRRQSLRLELANQVTFTGPLTGSELAITLNGHQILVVPSVWSEPFGIVALEGCACGCVVVGSANGGLPEAIGPCGVTFPNGDVIALADRIEQILANPAVLEDFRSARSAHLSSHSAAVVARNYARLFQSAILKS